LIGEIEELELGRLFSWDFEDELESDSDELDVSSFPTEFLPPFLAL